MSLLTLDKVPTCLIPDTDVSNRPTTNNHDEPFTIALLVAQLHSFSWFPIVNIHLDDAHSCCWKSADLLLYYIFFFTHRKAINT